jgi:hypothetical protein
LEEVAVCGGLEVLMEVDKNSLLIVGNPQELYPIRLRKMFVKLMSNIVKMINSLN